jgi:hypothetical protein
LQFYSENNVGNNAFHAKTNVKRPQNLSIISAQTVSIKQPRTECVNLLISKRFLKFKKFIFKLQYCKTTQTDDERISGGEFSMGSQEFAFDDEVSIDEGAVGQIGSFDESPTREIRKHLSNLQFNNHGGHQVFFLKFDFLF